MKLFLTSLFLVSSISFVVAQERFDFSFRTVDGEERKLANVYTQGPTLISFWALWCEPCKVELRALNKLFEKYRSKGFSIIAINQDSPRSVSKVRSYAAIEGFSFTIAVDPNGELFQAVNAQAIPYSLLLDTHGAIRYKRLGYVHGDETKLEQELLTLLSESK